MGTRPDPIHLPLAGELGPDEQPVRPVRGADRMLYSPARILRADNREAVLLDPVGYEFCNPEGDKGGGVRATRGFQAGDTVMVGELEGEVTQSDLGRAEPIYEELPGWWEDVSDARTFDDLPAKARDYVLRLEELAGAHVSCIGVGPGRDQTIVRRDVLAARP